MKYLKFSILAVMLLALVAGSAQAQRCIVDVKSPTVRSEGVTEKVGDIKLLCAGPSPVTGDSGLTFGSTVPTKLEIAVTLNADITNTRDGSDMVAHSDGTGNVTLTANPRNPSTIPTDNTAITLDTAVDLADPDAAATAPRLSKGDVSDDLRTITWKAMDTDSATDGIQGLTGDDTFQLGENGSGFQLTIAGLLADASGVGDNITATVKVNGSTIGTADMSVASVMNGLEVSVKAAEGTECADTNEAATVTIKEGFKKAAFMQSDSFMVMFKNIPEGVTVMVPEMVGLAKNDEGTNADEAAQSFTLDLVEGTPGDGVGKPEGGMAMVELTASGTGSVRYDIGTQAGTRDAVQADLDATPPPDGVDGNPVTALGDKIPADVNSVDGGNYQEWANLMVYFKWDGGNVVMNADAMVYVSFHPTTGGAIPRFVGEDDDAGAPLTIKDCVTNLTFPFVSSASGYDTGIVVSNTADAGGTCTASYSGSDETMTSPMIDGNSHWIFLVSTHMQDYTGRLEVECDFGGIDGYAQINDHMGNANGYLPRM